VDREHRLRMELLTLGLLGVFGLLIVRCYYIQGVRHEHYLSIADRQHLRQVKQSPRRGSITDRNGMLLAVSRQLPSVFGNPRRISDPARVAHQLAALLPVDEEKIKARLSRKGRHFVWIARHISPDVASSIRELKLRGIGFRMEAKRSYPNNELAAQLLGFCGTDQQGLAGLERAWSREMNGVPGSQLHLRDGRLKYGTIHMPGALGTPAQHGADVITTIDLAIQRITEKALEAAYQRFKPKRAIAIVLQVGTGDILAMAQRPTFDPNHFARSPKRTWRNAALLDLYEPGSTIKPLIACFALAEGLYDTNSQIDCQNGTWRYRGRTIRDHKRMGRQSFADVVVHSSNIGMAKITLRLGPARLARYLSASGFAQQPRQLRFPGLVAGRLKARPGPWSYWSTTSVAYGYEIMVSPLQLAAGINMLASGGVRTPPRLVRRLRRPSQPAESVGRRLVTEQVVPRAAARQMCQILARVVEEGTGKKAKLKRYKVGGKTGTAKKLNPDGTWSSTLYRSSFVGFAPVNRPVLTVMVLMDEAQVDSGKPYGGRVAAPTVARIIQQALDYMGVAS